MTETVWTLKVACVSWTRRKHGKTKTRVKLHWPKTVRPVPDGRAYQRRLRARRKRK